MSFSYPECLVSSAFLFVIVTSSWSRGLTHSFISVHVPEGQYWLTCQVLQTWGQCENEELIVVGVRTVLIFWMQMKAPLNAVGLAES